MYLFSFLFFFRFSFFSIRFFFSLFQCIWIAGVRMLCLSNPVVVLALTHRYNAVRGHRTGANNSGVEDYLRRKKNETKDNTHDN